MGSGECRECGKKVSVIAPACPNCEHVWVKPANKLHLIATGVVILVVVVAVVLIALNISK
jgi:hypothetical protein